ncbi:hypothetical protein EON65_43340 [archaeon]|nr:MAG: hypothetical protein EON65_43340 [archaeon]
MQCDDYLEDALEYLTWSELMHQTSTNTLCSEDGLESRKLVYLSLREMGVPSMQNIFNNLVIEEVCIPSISLSVRSQPDKNRCVHVAYRNILFTFTAPSAAFPINEVTSQLLNALEPEAETGVQRVLWHEEMVQAMLKYAHTQVLTQVATGHTQQDESVHLHCVADDRALTSVLNNISAEEVYHDIQSGGQDIVSQYTSLLKGLVDSAASKCDMLVVLRCAMAPMSQDCLTESLSVFLEHIY